MPKLDFDLKDFTTEEGTNVKIKNIQHSAIGIVVVSCIKRDIFTS